MVVLGVFTNKRSVVGKSSTRDLVGGAVGPLGDPESVLGLLGV